jgi:hypothetical protein
MLLHIFCFRTWLPPSENQESFPGQASRPLELADNAEDGRLQEGRGKLFPPEVNEWLRRWRRSAPGSETIRFSGWTSGFLQLLRVLGATEFGRPPALSRASDLESSRLARPSLPKSLLPPRPGKSLRIR